MASARNLWVKIKDDSKKAGLKATDVVGKTGFGVLLDKLEEKRKAWEAQNKKQPVDAVKLKAALDACQAAQKTAHDMCQQLAQAFKNIEDHTTPGPAKIAAAAVGGELMAMINLIKNYRTMGGA